jgi:hypothetical protein
LDDVEAHVAARLSFKVVDDKNQMRSREILDMHRGAVAVFLLVYVS